MIRMIYLLNTTKYYSLIALKMMAIERLDLVIFSDCLRAIKLSFKYHTLLAIDSFGHAYFIQERNQWNRPQTKKQIGLTPKSTSQASILFTNTQINPSINRKNI